jgi:glycosyltransferase involved in cell wall biosynthesis
MQYHQDQEPLVSICIPVFNGEKTIEKTIDSLLNQTFKNIEIFVVDNCSSDSTVKIVKEFSDSRIHLVLNDIHLPCGEYNWNRCFHYARGEFMAIFHADDIYLPDMVLRQVETFRIFPSVVAVFTQGNIINENDEIIGEFKLPLGIKGGEPHDYQKIFNSALEYADFLPTPSAMVRREIYQKFSPFRYDQFCSASDFDMWLRLAEYGPIIILDEKLMNYRVSKTQGTNIINRLRTHESDYFRVMDFHITNNDETLKISKRAMDSYDLSRFGDQLLCSRNSLYKKDWNAFSDQIKKIPWLKYIRIMIKDPRLLVSKFQLYSYFRIFKA